MCVSGLSLYCIATRAESELLIVGSLLLFAPCEKATLACVCEIKVHAAKMRGCFLHIRGGIVCFSLCH